MPPWAGMFEAAQNQESAQGRAGDVVPYWLYPGDAKIERMVLILLVGRVERYENLKKSLATYRLALGQPRQDELLELFSAFGSDVVAELADLQISLRPVEINRRLPIT